MRDTAAGRQNRRKRKSEDNHGRDGDGGVTEAVLQTAEDRRIALGHLEARFNASMMGDKHEQFQDPSGRNLVISLQKWNHLVDDACEWFSASVSHQQLASIDKLEAGHDNSPSSSSLFLRRTSAHILAQTSTMVSTVTRS